MKTAFRALVRKDVQLFLVDRRALLMSFAIPIAIAHSLATCSAARVTDKMLAGFLCCW